MSEVTHCTTAKLKAISKDPRSAYRHAMYVIKGRWPEAEETISTDPEWAYQYAHDIKGRWPEAEETISKNSEWAYFYALSVIEGRWPEAEETISKNPEWAYYYARNVIKGRWPEAEVTIINCFAQKRKVCADASGWACNYAASVIKGRWLEAEELFCDVSLCSFDIVKEYVSQINWASPLNDFPIPKRVKRALAC